MFFSPKITLSFLHSDEIQMIKVILLLFVVFDFNPKDFSFFFWVIDGNQDDFTDIEMEAHLDPRRCSMSFSIRSHHQRKDFINAD